MGAANARRSTLRGRLYVLLLASLLPMLLFVGHWPSDAIAMAREVSASAPRDAGAAPASQTAHRAHHAGQPPHCPGSWSGCRVLHLSEASTPSFRGAWLAVPLASPPQPGAHVLSPDRAPPRL